MPTYIAARCIWKMIEERSGGNRENEVKMEDDRGEKWRE